jgi:hypothetical protein
MAIFLDSSNDECRLIVAQEVEVEDSFSCLCLFWKVDDENIADQAYNASKSALKDAVEVSSINSERLSARMCLRRSVRMIEKTGVIV